MKLILDTDPGVDDAMTYFYAHAHPAIDLIGITTVFGNVTTQNATRNATWLTQMSHADTVVVPGADRPLQIKPNGPSDFVHGPGGFGDVDIGKVEVAETTEDAASYLARMARETPGDITVCAIGPLTNIAQAIALDPSFVSNLKSLVIMGGSLDAGGNITEFAEANFWNDPHAADAVLNAQGDVDIVIVGLDVTTKIAFFEHDFDDIATASPVAGDFLRQIGKFYLRFYETVTGIYQAYLHDPAALIAAQMPGLFEMYETPLSITCEGKEIGQMLRSNAPHRPKCRVAMTVDANAVIATFKDIVGRNP